MRSIDARYSKRQNHNGKGSYIIFAEAIKGQKFTRDAIVRNFNILVPKDEYVPSERMELIDHLEDLTNLVVESEIKPKNQF